MKKKVSILFALVLTVSLLMVPAAVSAAAYTLAGSAITVDSLEVPFPTGAKTEPGFNAEPETLVLDGMAYDAQSAGPVTIAGAVSDLVLGAGWEDTAYVEIGLRPEATMNARNAGVYLIAFNLPGEGGTRIHLQDYTGSGQLGGLIDLPAKNTGFSYVITLTPNTGTGIGGSANLEVWVDEVSQGTVTLDYGYASSWVEGAQGALDEDFTYAHLFYSIIAECRGVAGETYSATVGDITIAGADPSGNMVGFTADVSDVIAISVSPTTIGFGSVVPGVDATGDTITVGNAGNVAIALSASLENEAGNLYTNYLDLDASGWINWTATVGVGGTATAVPKLSGIPANFTPGSYTATLVFWAEKQ